MGPGLDDNLPEIESNLIIIHLLTVERPRTYNLLG
ncbi:unnamed protein product [Paramecium primaurelia]|uniref:Uncharacterized protein n=1 Tax=Paramecium primaurelia TaxID=5886 RepID=A0A8S1LUG9_PARPR|nr:unnamed protein product [Paramecium primaurelia]